jgi:hypothetical protein
LSLVIPLLLLIAAVPLVLALLRANELFCLRVRGRNVRVIRGRIPQGLLNDIVDVFEKAPAETTMRALVEDGRARVYVDGELSEGVRQRLRNVVAMWPVAKIRNAPRPRRGGTAAS